jgi:SAM-dependent methyltransferase
MEDARASVPAVDSRRIVAGEQIFQRRQPPGVPPLEMTGERTLPDVPRENYWYQRHVVVYQWVAERTAGRTVIDMACGEGYGSAILARTASSVLGVDANPEAYEHARAKYVQSNLSFSRELIEEVHQKAQAVVFLQTIEHVTHPDILLAHFKTLLTPEDGALYVSTPNVLTLAALGAAKSENPWHVKEYRPEEFAAAIEAQFPRVELYGLFPARKLALHAALLKRLRLAPDLMFRSNAPSAPFYRLFSRIIASSDFRLVPVSEPEQLGGALDLLAIGYA